MRFNKPKIFVMQKQDTSIKNKKMSLPLFGSDGILAPALANVVVTVTRTNPADPPLLGRLGRRAFVYENQIYVDVHDGSLCKDVSIDTIVAQLLAATPETHEVAQMPAAVADLIKLPADAPEVWTAAVAHMVDRAAAAATLSRIFLQSSADMDTVKHHTEVAQCSCVHL